MKPLPVSRRVWVAWLVLALVATTGAGTAQAGFVTVAAHANIYGAGHPSAPGPAGSGGGSLPPTVTVASGDLLTFQVSGLVSYNGGGNFYGADGGLFGPTLMDPFGGLSGIQHGMRRFFLVGVFLSDQEPGGAPPPTLDFSNDAFASVAPGLNQLFFIGDGLTGTGGVQLFYAPTGATRFALGFADGFDFAGPPGTYGDNVGSLDVAYSVTPVPEPSGVALLGFGCLILAVARSRGFGRLLAPATASYP